MLAGRAPGTNVPFTVRFVSGAQTALYLPVGWPLGPQSLSRVQLRKQEKSPSPPHLIGFAPLVVASGGASAGHLPPVLVTFGAHHMYSTWVILPVAGT